MVKIHLHGKLRKYNNSSGFGKENVLSIQPEPEETIDSILIKAGIPLEEIYHIFYNHKLLATHCTLAKTLGYRQEREDPNNWDLNIPVNSGDRIGIFGSDMSALVV